MRGEFLQKHEVFPCINGVQIATLLIGGHGKMNVCYDKSVCCFLSMIASLSKREWECCF